MFKSLISSHPRAASFLPLRLTSPGDGQAFVLTQAFTHWLLICHLSTFFPPLFSVFSKHGFADLTHQWSPSMQKFTLSLFSDNNLHLHPISDLQGNKKANALAVEDPSFTWWTVWDISTIPTCISKLFLRRWLGTGLLNAHI